MAGYASTQQVVNDLVIGIVTSITPELWYLFFKMLVTVCITLLVYQLLKNISAYVMCRFDREISKNVKVLIDGEECLIAHINMRHLIIKKKGGHSELLIPITKVGQMNWEVVKNGIGENS